MYDAHAIIKCVEYFLHFSSIPKARSQYGLSFPGGISLYNLFRSISVTVSVCILIIFSEWNDQGIKFFTDKLSRINFQKSKALYFIELLNCLVMKSLQLLIILNDYSRLTLRFYDPFPVTEAIETLRSLRATLFQLVA